MGKGISKKNEERLRVYLQRIENRTPEVKTEIKKDGNRRNIQNNKSKR